MIELKTGNILESSADCLVNTVNCEGFMGKGIAYQFKTKYPRNNDSYVKACNNGSLTVGRLHVFKEDDKFIVNFPTKNKWREKSRYSYIEAGLEALVSVITTHAFSSIAIPPLGCGNGGLEWGKVRPLIEEVLEAVSFRTHVELYAPSKNYSAQITQAPVLTFSHYLLMSLKVRLLNFNALRLQKAAFLVNLFSGKEYFKFSKHHYGPYAHSVEILSKQIKEYQLYYHLETASALLEVKRVLISKNFEKNVYDFESVVAAATRMVNSIESDRDLELTSSILYLIWTGELKHKNDLPSLIKDWSDRKSEIFSEKNLYETFDQLEKGSLIREGIHGYEFVS